jgi:hypothetical protein
MLKSLFSGFQQQKTINPSGHLHAVDLPPNYLLTQLLTDDNLDAALDWLRDNSREQDHSDVWNVSRDWVQRKADLQARVRSGEFEFQTVREVEIEVDGQTEIREIRCAEDRILIRAITQVLQPVFAEQIAPECVHLAGRGGTQQAVKAAHEQLVAQPKAFVMKSDVKGYYAQIDHLILHEQFCTLLPHEIELQRLLWQFMQRTVERGGNYRDVARGIPLGASLSPLLGALYLSPLDALFSGDEQHFYRRYMDDWVIFCNNRWDLRKVVKQVYAVLHALRVTVAEDKSYIGKASKGFDFLGKRILPIGVLPSQAALSRMQKNTVRLIEPRASKKRIWKYWIRWLGWAGMLPLAATAYTPADGGGDTGHTFVPLLRCQGAVESCYWSSLGKDTYVLSDWDSSSSNFPFAAALPDDDPSPGDGASARFYSFAKTSSSASVPPTVSGCGCCTVDEETYSTSVYVADGDSCSLTVTPQANGDPYADVVYTGTLSRSGNIYTLTGGSVCGGVYGACAPPPSPPPVSASTDSPLMLFFFSLGIIGVAVGLRKLGSQKG